MQAISGTPTPSSLPSYSTPGSVDSVITDFNKRWREASGAQKKAALIKDAFDKNNFGLINDKIANFGKAVDNDIERALLEKGLRIVWDGRKPNCILSLAEEDQNKFDRLISALRDATDDTRRAELIRDIYKMGQWSSALNGTKKGKAKAITTNLEISDSIQNCLHQKGLHVFKMSSEKAGEVVELDNPVPLDALSSILLTLPSALLDIILGYMATFRLDKLSAKVLEKTLLEGAAETRQDLLMEIVAPGKKFAEKDSFIEQSKVIFKSKGVNLSKANFERANFQGFFFNAGFIKNALFRHANLQKTDFEGTDCSGSDFSYANLQGATFREPSFGTTRPPNSPKFSLLNKVKFIQADLTYTDLRGVTANEANFSEARLCGARLCGASLKNAILENADLTGADLSGADLTGARIEGMLITESMMSQEVLLDGGKVTLGNLIEKGLIIAKVIASSEDSEVI